jgi:hypothetical protein
VAAEPAREGELGISTSVSPWEEIQMYGCLPMRWGTLGARKPPSSGRAACFP